MSYFVNKVINSKLSPYNIDISGFDFGIIFFLSAKPREGDALIDIGLWISYLNK